MGIIGGKPMEGDTEKKTGEKLVEEISKVAKAMEAVNSSKFTKTLLILYIQDKTKLGKAKIESILNIIEEFAEEMNEE
jgi:hypothetical protein